MKRRQLLKHLAAAPALAAFPYVRAAATAAGPFSPNWQSLSAYKTPDWFRNAKFGIWAHWGPQCEPEFGDWYAHSMYEEGSDAYRHHLQKYGHPSVFGFKDVIRQWKAEQWDPERLMALYKKAGAKYFVGMANHHDNFDLYDSKHQPWNATKIGPRKDLIAGWSKAARNNGLRFGVSVHAAHTWTWYEPAQGADKSGPYAGVPYDGRLTRADGQGQWWDGLDPQALYAQRHPLSKPPAEGEWEAQWNWAGGAAIPDRAYCEKFYDRTVDLIDAYDPDLVYFDDTALPLWPHSDAGLRLAAHMYNKSIAGKGRLEAVINGKLLDELQRQCMVWDFERGQSNVIEPFPWQKCMCIGHWHYDRRLYDEKRYQSAQAVVHMLIDVVSKNGNLLLNIPVRGNGAIDEQEHAIVEEIGRWMAVNGDAVYGTRPWSVYGEGPGGAAPTAADMRFTARDDAVYAVVMGWPDDGRVLIKSMRSGSPHLKKSIARVEIAGRAEALKFRQTAEGLQVTLPAERPALPYAAALKIV